MEQEIAQKDFDFSKKTEKIIEKKVIFNENLRKRAKFASFLIIGGLTVGLGLGIGNGLMKSYLIDKQKNADIEFVLHKNEELRKTEQNQVAMKQQQIQNEINIKENQKRAAEEEKVALQQSKSEYNLLMKNKAELISNYESQLTIYDKAYQDSVTGVKNGLMDLNDLTEIRDLYQGYKKDIHAWIKFIYDGTETFEIYNSLNEEDKTALKEELNKYQNGDLNRSNDLENMLVQKIGDNSNDDENDKRLANLRTTARNKMIDDLADVVKNDNTTTKTKKLKR